MKECSKKLVVIQTVIPDYRLEFFKEIKQNLRENFELFGGNYYFDKSIISDPKIQKNQVKNYFLVKRKLLFQTGIWHLLFKNVILVLEMNPRIISNWIFLIVRGLLNKETVLWGHAWLIVAAIGIVFSALIAFRDRGPRKSKSPDALAIHSLVAMSQVAIADGRIDDAVKA